MLPSSIPDKPYFKIGEAAALVGVKPSVLRFWETEFRAVRPPKSRSNQRLYTRRHIELLLQVKELLYDRGYTIAGAKKALRDGDRGDAAAGSRASAAGSSSPVTSAPAPFAAPAGGPGLDPELLERVKKELRELLQLVDE